MKSEMNFFFAGKYSYDYGVYIERLPDIILPVKKRESLSIPGRSGAVNLYGGIYEDYVRTVDCAIKNSEYINEIIRWLSDGEGQIIFSNEPDKYYNGYLKDNSLLKHEVLGLQKFKLNFMVEPFKYNVGWRMDELEITKSGTRFLGKGTYESQPIITVYGSGNITLVINSNQMLLNAVGGSITLDCAEFEAYNGAVLLNNSVSGSFFMLSPESNTISWSGNVSKIIINPRWRWL